MTVFCLLCQTFPSGVEQFVIHVNNKCINFATYVCTKDRQAYSLEYRGLERNIPASFVVDSFLIPFLSITSCAILYYPSATNIITK